MIYKFLLRIALLNSWKIVTAMFLNFPLAIFFRFSFSKNMFGNNCEILLQFFFSEILLATAWWLPPTFCKISFGSSSTYYSHDFLRKLFRRHFFLRNVKNILLNDVRQFIQDLLQQFLLDFFSDISLDTHPTIPPGAPMEIAAQIPLTITSISLEREENSGVLLRNFSRISLALLDLKSMKVKPPSLSQTLWDLEMVWVRRCIFE